MAEPLAAREWNRLDRSSEFERGASYERVTGMRRDPARPRLAGLRRPVRLNIDVPLLLVVSTLCIFGLLMVYSASWEYSLVDNSSPANIFVRQIFFMLVGITGATILAFIDYHLLQKVAVPAMAATFIALVAVLLFGQERHNAVRSLFGGSVQPSEMAKLVIIIYLGVWLYAKRDQLGQIGFGLLPLSAILGVFGGLIMLQPDLSAVVTIILLGGVLFFLAGGDMKQITIMVVGAVIIGALVVYLSPTGSNRLGTFLPGLKDPTQASYHVRRSFEAFVRGGWLGVGIGKGKTKLTGLPVPHTDSIFAVVGEETGVAGSVLLVALFGLLLWRGLLIAQRAPDGLGSLLASGMSIWLVSEAFINMAVMVGLLPFAGNALPFISAGGSNLIVSMAAIGILFNISRLSHKNLEAEERSFGSVVDLRRRDWRRSKSGSRRPAGAERE